MSNPTLQLLKFSINGWTHLYSLQQAILHNQQHTGRTLDIKGRVVGNAFLNRLDTDINISFLQAEGIPEYPVVEGKNLSLGLLSLSNNQIETQISVDRQVFEELRKNLMEYADIEGIHIIVTLGLLSSETVWKNHTSLNLIQLDYAMKGDA